MASAPRRSAAQTSRKVPGHLRGRRRRRPRGARGASGGRGGVGGGGRRVEPSRPALTAASTVGERPSFLRRHVVDQDAWTPDESCPSRRATPPPPLPPSDWSIERATQYYNMAGWGAGFFSVNEKGHVVVHPHGPAGGPTIDLMDVVEDIQEREHRLPVRGPLPGRAARPGEAASTRPSRKARGRAWATAARYYGVYPIKVNQMREVVEEILDAGAPYHYGLEAGSKGELLIVLGMQHRPRGAHHLQRLQGRGVPAPGAARAQARAQGDRGHREALRAARTCSGSPRRCGVEPLIGLRSKLTTRGTGKWEGSSGDFAKFGLTTPELIHAVRILKEAGQGALRQAPPLPRRLPAHRDPRRQGRGQRGRAGLRQAPQDGAAHRVLRRGRRPGRRLRRDAHHGYASSMNYTLEEYVADVVYNVQRICAERGGARAAHRLRVGAGGGRPPLLHHHERLRPHRDRLAPRRSPPPRWRSPDEPKVVREMREIVASITPRNRAEAYHDAVAKKEEALQMFKLGILGLEERAVVESLFWKLAREHGRPEPRQEAAAARDARTWATRSPTSTWPTSRSSRARPTTGPSTSSSPSCRCTAWTRRPRRDCTIVDITCDSDGKIDRFIEGDGRRRDALAARAPARASPTTWACS